MKKKKFEKSIRRFIRFLKENNVFYAFRSNYDVYFCFKSQPDITCRQYLDKLENYNFITYAFHWADSNEGHDFWSKLDTKWRSIIRLEGL